MIFELFGRKENETKEKNFLFDWIENRRKKKYIYKMTQNISNKKRNIYK